MTPRKSNQSPSKKAPAIKVPVKEQVSAGGVVFRGDKGKIEVVIISVGGQNRWQLPKGMVEKGESPETAAVREAREEAGVSSEVVQLIETIERRGQQVWIPVTVATLPTFAAVAGASR